MTPIPYHNTMLGLALRKVIYIELRIRFDARAYAAAHGSQEVASIKTLLHCIAVIICGWQDE